jgi:hypothetical protein
MWMMSRAFGAQFSEEERRVCTTPERCTQVICSKVEMGGTPAILSDRALESVRRALSDALARAPGSFEPWAKVDELFPEETRIAAWATFTRALYGRAYPLSRPHWLRFAVALAAAVSAAVGLIVALPVAHGLGMGSTASMILAMTAGCLVAAIVVAAATLVSKSMRTEFGDDPPTVQDLADGLLQNPALLKKDDPRWTRDQVFEVVRALAANRLAVEVDEVTGETPLRSDAEP